MNEVINNILTRRSVRDFNETQVSKEDMELLIKTGLYAPSGRGMQSWKFTGVMNQDLIHEIENVISEVLGRKNYSFYKSKSIILISNEIGGKWSKEDNACALQNIMLAAHSMGIGSVWINQLQDICDHEIVRPLLDKMGIPENHEVYGLAALGYQVSESRGIVEKKGEFTIIE